MTDLQPAKSRTPTPPTEQKPAAYFFLDEGGNLDFAATGTRYYTMTCLGIIRPFGFDEELNSLKLDCIERGLQLSCFHASEDSEETRNAVFNIIHKHFGTIFRLDRVVVRKSEIQPAIQGPEKFYSETLGFLIKQALQQVTLRDFSQVIMVTDTLPPGRKGGGIERAIKHVLKTSVAPQIRYRILHRPSSEWFGLQVADYLNWAFFRRWERSDPGWDTRVPSRFAQYVVGTDKGEIENPMS